MPRLIRATALTITCLIAACGSDSTGPTADLRCHEIAQVDSWSFNASHQILFDSIIPGGDTVRIKEGLTFDTIVVADRHVGGDSVTWTAIAAGNAFIHDTLRTHLGGSFVIESVGAAFDTTGSVKVYVDLAACSIRVRSQGKAPLFSTLNGGPFVMLGTNAVGGEVYGPFPIVDSVVTTGIHLGDIAPATVLVKYFNPPDSATSTVISPSSIAGGLLGNATTTLGTGSFQVRLTP